VEKNAMKALRVCCVFITLVFQCAMPVSAAETGGKADGLFWSVTGENGRSYLLGTIHSEDPRVLEFTDEFIAALGACDVFAMELVPDLPTLASLMERMNYKEGTSLPGVIGQTRFEALTAALAVYHLPAEQVARMKPWAAMMTLSVPPPETGLFMDFSLSLRASGSGLKVIGLETLEQQLSFLENMPLEQQLELLDQALQDFTGVQEVHDRMVDSYLGGSLEALLVDVQQQMADLKPETRHYFMQQGIIDRNHTMLESLLPQLQQGCVFTAVGALHLAGPDGLIDLLRAKGYQVEALASPFPTSADQL
jgi:uncharacterized protein YbaP (TraB family)